MGAWGTRSFENDTAGDWFVGLREKGHGLIEQTLREVVDRTDDYSDPEMEAEAVAAAEIVATMAGRPDPETEEKVVALATSFGSPSPVLIELSQRAVEMISAEESELRELWEDDPEWLGRMGDLKMRLEG